MFETDLHTTNLYKITFGKHRNWRNLLKFGESLTLEERRRYLWVWPTEADIENLKSMFTQMDVSIILSIGCGSGLLEWIIKESIGITIYGLEIDKRWWSSRYAIKSFINVYYIEQNDNTVTPLDSRYLQDCVHVTNWHFAILFCYFNNRTAFLNYLNLYKGSWIVIIGPAPNSGIYSDPNPLEPNFPNGSLWRLCNTSHMCNNNVVSLYTNKEYC